MKTHNGNSTEARRERAEHEKRDDRGRFATENKTSNSSHDRNHRGDNARYEERDAEGRFESNCDNKW